MAPGKISPAYHFTEIAMLKYSNKKTEIYLELNLYILESQKGLK